MLKVITAELSPIRAISNEPVLIEGLKLAIFKQLAVSEMVTQPSDLKVNMGFVAPTSAATYPSEHLLCLIERIWARSDVDERVFFKTFE